MKSAASLGQQLAGARVDRIIKRPRASATPLPFPALEGRVLVMMPMGADRTLDGLETPASKNRNAAPEVVYR